MAQRKKRSFDRRFTLCDDMIYCGGEAPLFSQVRVGVNRSGRFGSLIQHGLAEERLPSFLGELFDKSVHRIHELVDLLTASSSLHGI